MHVVPIFLEKVIIIVAYLVPCYRRGTISCRPAEVVCVVPSLSLNIDINIQSFCPLMATVMRGKIVVIVERFYYVGRRFLSLGGRWAADIGPALWYSHIGLGQVVQQSVTNKSNIARFAILNILAVIYWFG